MSDPEQRISIEVALQLLTKQQRREVIRRLADAPDGTTVDRLTKQLGGTDSMTPNGDEPIDRRGIELQHAHLPKLQQAGVIEYDSDQQTVRRGRHFEDVLGLLRLIEEYREDVSTMTV